MAFSLEAVFGVDASGVRATMKSLRRDLNDFVADWTKIGAGAAVGVFVALGKGAIDLAGKLSDTSQNLGINVESLQALEAQHKRNGVSSDQLTKALEKTKLAVINAASGNAAATASLEKLGLKAADLIKLPLDQQYEAIAKAAAKAKDQNEAYAAVSALLGERVGPKLMTSLRELANDGLPAVMKSATEAGHVMRSETVAALDRAGDAIDDFKKRATIAVGNILVNFRSEEGLKLLGMQLMKVLAEFGGGILDAFKEAGDMARAVLTGAFRGVLNYFQDGMVENLKLIAAGLNKILPEKWEINIAGLDSLKSTGASVADEITSAIAQTSPSTFKKDFGESWARAITEQKQIVDALDKARFGADADKLKAAGDAIEAGAQAVERAAAQGGVHLSAGATAAGQSLESSSERAATIQKAAVEYVRDRLGDGVAEDSKVFVSAVSTAADVLTRATAESSDAQLDAALQSAKIFGDSATQLWNSAVDAAFKIASAASSWSGGGMDWGIGGDKTSKSDAALKGEAWRLQQQIDEIMRSRVLPDEQWVLELNAARPRAELKAVQDELNARGHARNTIERLGEDQARFSMGDAIVDRAMREMQDTSTRTAVGVEQLNEKLKRLVGGD